MKKLLLSFLTLVVAAVCGVSASAQAWSTTVKWTDPGSIIIKKGTSYTTATVVDIAPDATEVTLTEATGYFVIGAEGYEVVNGDLNGTIKQAITVDYSTGIKGISIRAQYGGDRDAYKGKTLVVNVVKLENKPFNLEVANGASATTFKFYNNGSEVSALSGVVDGKNTLEFPTTANQLLIQGSSIPRSAYYSVKLDGEEQALANTIQNYYLVPLTEGCNIYVAKEDPATAKSFEVTFKFTNGNPNIISNIYNNSTSKFIMPDVFGAAGYKLIVPENGQFKFNWNEEATIESLTQNGKAVTITKPTQVTITENTEFVITGKMTEYEAKTVQLYLNDTENVDFTANGEKLDLTYVKDVPAGTVTLPSGYTISIDTKLYEATVQAKPNAGVTFNVHNGYYVKTGSRGTLAGAFAEPEDVDLAGTEKIMLENMPLFLNVAKINYTSTAWIYYDGPENSGKLQSKSPDGMFAPYEGEKSILTKGWHMIKFDPEYNSEFIARISITFDNQNWTKTVVLDGTPIKSDENDNFNMPYTGTNTGNEDGKEFTNGKMEDNSVLKMFFTPVATPAYYITFDATATQNAEVSYDQCKTIDLKNLPTNERITAYGPTPFVIKPGAGVTVKVDGVAQTPNAEGIVEFTATKKSTISFDAERDNTAEPGTAVGAGTTVRNLNAITYNVPFDGEHSIWYDDITAVTLTPKAANRAAADAIHATAVEAGDPSDTSIPMNISFPEITEPGEYTLDIPAGVFYQTAWDETTQTFTYQPGCKGYAAYTATFTLDPNKPYTFTFNPAAGSDNEFPEDGQIIVISVDGETLTAPETTTAGPWVKFNGVDIKKVDDAYEEKGWSWTETMDTYGKPAVAMLISQEVFTTIGTLEITANENAFIIDGKQTSPAIEYTANFGEKKEYQVVFTPEAGSTVPALAPEFSITFEGAKTLAIDENMFDAYFNQGLLSGVQINKSQVTINGNTATIKLENEENFPVGNYLLEIFEGSFIIDGNQPNDKLEAAYVIERSTEYNQEWTPTPTKNVANYGYGIGVGFAFGEDESLSKGTAYDQIEVFFDGEKLPPYDPAKPEIAGYQLDIEPSMPYVLMVNAMGGKISENTTTGELTATVPAGAINISGKPLEKEATYTWNFLAYKAYTWTADPEPGSKLAKLEKITLTFPDANSVSISEYFQNGWITVKSGWNVIASAKSVTVVKDAEVPTIEIEFEPISTLIEDCSISIGFGSFMLDDVFESDPIYLEGYVIDPNFTGIEGIVAEDGLYTVVSLQGVVLMKDVEADALDTLPAGLYIINGQKIYLRK